MLFLSIHFGHDASAVIAEDYKILAAVQLERLTRLKGDGAWERLPLAIDEALRIAGKDKSAVDVLCVSRVKFPIKYHRYNNPLKNVFYRLLKPKKKQVLSNRYKKQPTVDYRPVFYADKLVADLGLPPTTQFFDYGHHTAHALSALFYTDWDNALLYTADGGGDWLFYSAYHLKNRQLQTLYGSDKERFSNTPIHSIGLAYGYMTEALGYKINRHEGKLTGLAAYGKPALLSELEKHFWVREDGLVETDFKNKKEMQQTITALAATVKPADAACSIQQLLEKTILKSIGVYLQKTEATKIGLAGGVFANVSLNRRIAELPQVEEVFIFPGMGDEGIPVGGIYEFLLKRDGLATWLQNRYRLQNVYWGGSYDAAMDEFSAPNLKQIATPENASRVAAKHLAAGQIVALYSGRMEFGPRALGARSILASPVNKSVNDTLNQRLQRTEFMPFAPYVLAEDAEEVFEVTDTNRYAMRFMTITCKVREKWRDKISAVVHVDGTARPQIITDEDNPLYAAVLREFKQQTSLPVLVNTSFNAHEEPIIYTPTDCLRALRDGRVDMVLTTHGLYAVK